MQRFLYISKPTAILNSIYFIINMSGSVMWKSCTTQTLKTNEISWWSFSKYFVFLLSILSLIAVTVFTLQNLSRNQKLTEVFREDYPLLYDSNEQVFHVSYSISYTSNCKFSSTCYSWWLLQKWHHNFKKTIFETWKPIQLQKELERETKIKARQQAGWFQSCWVCVHGSVQLSETDCYRIFSCARRSTFVREATSRLIRCVDPVDTRARTSH